MFKIQVNSLGNLLVTGNHVVFWDWLEAPAVLLVHPTGVHLFRQPGAMVGFIL